MSTPQKTEIINDLTQKFQNSSGIYFTRYSGMNVAQATELRKQFRESDVSYFVKGDNVMVPYYGGRLTFQIIGVTPNANAVNVTQKTVFDIIDEKKEVEQRSGKKKEKRKKQSAKDKRIETLENVIKDLGVILDKFHLREGKQDFK